MIEARRGMAFVVWVFSLLLILASLSPWFVPRDILQNVGGASAFIIFILLVTFRSKYYADLVRSAPSKKIPAGIAFTSKMVVIYAAVMALCFFVLWFRTSSISIYANVMLSPFGALAFFMGRWIRFRP